MSTTSLPPVEKRRARVWRIIVGAFLLVGSANGVNARPGAGDLAESLGRLTGVVIIVSLAAWLIGSGLPRSLAPTTNLVRIRRWIWFKLAGVGLLIMLVIGLLLFSLSWNGAAVAAVLVSFIYWFGWTWIAWLIADNKAVRQLQSLNLVGNSMTAQSGGECQMKVAEVPVKGEERLIAELEEIGVNPSEYASQVVEDAETLRLGVPSPFDNPQLEERHVGLNKISSGKTAGSAPKLSKRRLRIVWGGIMVLVLCGLVPPWCVRPNTGFAKMPGLPSLPRVPSLPSVSGRGSGGGDRACHSAGYRPLFWPPLGDARVDTTRLGIQWVLIALIAGALLYTDKKRV